MPRGLQFVIAATVAIPMLIAGYAPNRRLWLRIERCVAAVVLPLTTALQLTLLAMLLIAMASKDSHTSGLTLLTTSIAIWVTNVLVFVAGLLVD